jgi:cystathionine beta-lyase/cystathionine gamma-synthase
VTDIADQKIHKFETLALHAGHIPLIVDNTTGVTPDYVRLSVGLESIDDILYDLDQALSGA